MLSKHIPLGSKQNWRLQPVVQNLHDKKLTNHGIIGAWFDLSRNLRVQPFPNSSSVVHIVRTIGQVCSKAWPREAHIVRKPLSKNNSWSFRRNYVCAGGVLSVLGQCALWFPEQHHKLFEQWDYFSSSSGPPCGMIRKKAGQPFAASRLVCIDTSSSINPGKFSRMCSAALWTLGHVFWQLSGCEVWHVFCGICFWHALSHHI